jgi:hypothetical protein
VSTTSDVEEYYVVDVRVQRVSKFVKTQEATRSSFGSNAKPAKREISRDIDEILHSIFTSESMNTSIDRAQDVLSGVRDDDFAEKTSGSPSGMFVPAGGEYVVILRRYLEILEKKAFPPSEVDVGAAVFLGDDPQATQPEPEEMTDRYNWPGKAAMSADPEEGYHTPQATQPDEMFPGNGDEGGVQ